MLDAVRSDIFRQRKRLMPTVLLVIFALIACALYVVPWIAEKAQGDEMNLRDLLDLRASLWIQNVIPYGLQFQSFFGLVLTAVLAGSSVGGEFSSGTVRTIIIRTRARWHFVGAKLSTVALFALLLPTLGMTLHLALAAAMTRDVGGNFDDVFTFAYAGDLATAVLRAFWCLLTYATLAVLLGVWTRSTAVAIAGSIGALFLEPLIVGLFSLAGEFFDDIAEVLPGANVDTVLGANGAIKGTPVPEVTEPGPFGLWGSTAILGGYIAAFTTLAVVLFQRRDITSE